MAIKGARGLGRFSRSLALGAGLATARFPVSVLIVLTLSTITHLEIAGLGFIAEPDLFWLVSALFAGLAASVGARLAAESQGASGISLALLPLAAAIGAGLVVWFAEPLSIFAPPLVAALSLSIPLAPYVARPDGKRFWMFSLWGGVGAALAFVSVLLFVLGVSTILEMVRFLFEIGPSQSAYEHIYAAALTLVGPLFALGRIPRDFDEMPAIGGDDRLTAGVRFLFDWVGAPLALATAAVLHLYAAKIVLLSEWPKNEIGWIASFYAVLVLSFRVAADPFIDGTAAVTTRLFGRLWAALLVVPVGLLLYAVSLRIGTEGVTTERYYLALGALAAALILLAQTWKRSRGDIRVMAGIPLVLLALSSAGPWSVGSIVARSQTALVTQEFAAVGLPNGTLADATFTEAQKASLRSRLRALEDVDALEAVLPLLPETVRQEAVSRVGGDAALLATILPELLHLDSAPATGAQRSFLVFNGGREAELAIGGFDLAVIGRTVGEDGSPRPAQDHETALGLSGSELVVVRGGSTDRFDLARLLATIPNSALEQGSPGPALPPIVVDLVSNGGRRARLSLSYALLFGADRRPSSVQGTLLLRSGDWPEVSSLGSDGIRPGSLSGGSGETKPSGTIR